MVFEVYLQKEDGTLECRVYEIDNACTRVLASHNRVWGFIETDDPNHPRQVEGRLVSVDENTAIYGENIPHNDLMFGPDCDTFTGGTVKVNSG